MRGRVEGRGGDARADRRAGSGPGECAEDPQAHPVRPGPAGDRDRPDDEGHPRRPARAAPPRPPCPDARVGGDAAEVLAAVGRRLDVGPELVALVAEAVEKTPTGRRDRDAPAERRAVTIDNLDMSL